MATANSKLILTTNTAEISKRLRELASKVRDRSKPAKQLAVQLLADTQRNFESYGKKFNNPWPQLAQSTQEYKSRHGWYVMLVRSGQLRDAFYQYSNDKFAAVGNSAPYASFHEKGTSRMPRRQILPSPEYAAKIGVIIFEKYLKDSVKEAGL